MNSEDRELGMGREISRRDFVNGVAVATGGAMVLKSASATSAEVADAMTAANYPPLRTGYRGQYPGSYDAAHAERDGTPVPEGEATGESYDLVVVGGGLSGLAAAWYYREKAGPSARILVLELLDDFGGHAQRSEFVYGGQKFMAPAGSAYFVNPTTWTYDAKRMVKALGVDTDKDLGQWHPEIFKSHGLKPATFFSKEAYGKDQLVVGGTLQHPNAEFLAQTPLSSDIKNDVMRLMTDAKVDYLEGLSKEEKIAKLRSMSYRDYLLNVVKVHPDVLSYTNGVWCLSNDTVSAWFAYFRYSPGFAGLGIERPKGSPEAPEYEEHNFYFPGGNHSFARLIVRSLIPDALPAGPYVNVETARTRYDTLDRPGQATRIRLGSTVVRARHVGTLPHQFEPDNREVEITYIKGGKSYKVMAKDVVMAGMNNMIPYMCPELPGQQKSALHEAVRAINFTIYAVFRNWESFAKLKAANIAYPKSFLSFMSLQRQRSFGGLQPSTDPSQPILVSYGSGAGIANEFYFKGLLGGNLPKPGTPVRDQMRMARAGLFRTPFETFERAVRKQSAGALSGGGFDPAKDIVALTVNRWGHGYALGRNHLFDNEDGPGPNVIGRQKFGHITIANSDASGIDNAQTAFDEAARAVRELEPRMYGYYESI